MALKLFKLVDGEWCHSIHNNLDELDLLLVEGYSLEPESKELTEAIENAEKESLEAELAQKTADKEKLEAEIAKEKVKSIKNKRKGKR